MGCFACCVPCDPCEAECDENPAESFDVVYQVEQERANLTWTGDAMGPIDGPWPGFESGVSFSQTITTNNVRLPGSRFPCYFRLKLWRNVGGGEGSEALDYAYTTVSCIEGKVDLGIVQLNAGESAVFTSDTSLSFNNPTYILETASGAIFFDDQPADRHAFPPTLSQIAGIALCAGTSVSVQSTIVWSNDLIQHNLYGEFQECFDEPPVDCSIDCDGTPVALPAELYLTLSNSTATVLGDGTVVLPGPQFCRDWGGLYTDGAYVRWSKDFATELYVLLDLPGTFVSAADIGIADEDMVALLCGDVESLTGQFSSNDASFDWELSL